MNKKDYKLIAHILHEIDIDFDFYPKDSLYKGFAKGLREHDPKFNEKEFKLECYKDIETNEK